MASSCWQRTAARFEMRRHSIWMEQKTANGERGTSVTIEWPREAWIAADVRQAPHGAWIWSVYLGGNGYASGTAPREAGARAKAMKIVRSLSAANRARFTESEEIPRRLAEGYRIREARP